ncbi:MAG: YihY/virulence factor BrkB family protein [bacterium]|nr:YihY/virulence factor BrkB family protein [bacterium]
MDWKERVLDWQARIQLRLDYITRQWMRIEPRWRALPAHLWRAIVNFKDNGTRQAAALAYYAVFSVFPLTLLLAIGVSRILEPTIAQEQISNGLQLFLPEESATIQLVRDSVTQALQQNSSFGLVALLGLIWSALGLFSNFTDALDQIFQVPTSRSLWRQRLLGFLMTLVLIVLIITSFMTSGLLSLVDAVLIATPSVWISIGSLLLPLGLNMVIFVLLFRYIPARRVHWDAIWPAALLGGMGLEAAKAGFGWYLTNLANFQFVYGSIATVIVLLLWVYLAACIFLLSAEVCAQLDLWFTAQQETPRVSVVLENRLAQLPNELPPPV